MLQAIGLRVHANKSCADSECCAAVVNPEPRRDLPKFANGAFATPAADSSAFALASAHNLDGIQEPGASGAEQVATTAQILPHDVAATARCSACCSSDGPPLSARNCFGTVVPLRVVIRLVRRRASPAASKQCATILAIVHDPAPSTPTESFGRLRTRVCTHN